MNKFSLGAVAVTALLATACATLEPQLPAAQPAVAAEWPTPTSPPTSPSSPADAAATTPAADIAWNDFFVDPNLKTLIARALENNRDLRVAVLNVERARAQYGVQRADRFPSLNASVTGNRSGGDRPLIQEGYIAELGVTGFELDLFGRVRNLSEAALQQYFATDEARRSAQITLIAEVARAYLTLSADTELQRITQATLENYTAFFELTERRHQLGAISSLDVQQARTAVESARADVARFKGQVAQDTNALTLLVGSSINPSLLPLAFVPDASGLSALPAGLPSDVLLRRPDILQAERLLRSANANIGAARAAFFPSITLTGSVGTTSSELSGLFEKGSSGWSFIPSINLPIFQGGRLRSGLGLANADRDIALAQYEKSIQSGFREVADALALSGTLAEQRIAQEALVDAATRAENLSQARYKAGEDSYIVLLDAQRTLYSARQSRASTQLAEQANRVTLYKVLGGGWK
jgi:multidrug efflux system outer membrane protein